MGKLFYLNLRKRGHFISIIPSLLCCKFGSFPIRFLWSSSQIMSNDFVLPSISIIYLFSYIGCVLYFQVFEHSSFCLTCIVEAIASSPDKLDEICNHGLIEQVTSIISTSNSGGVQSSLSTSTYTVVEYLHFQIDCLSFLG